jgi:hypothetical protein
MVSDPTNSARKPLNVPSIGMHVKVVVLCGADEKMVRSNTGRNITVMANVQPIWNLSVVDLPGEPVDTHSLPFGRSDDSIATTPGFGSNPQPAGLGFLHAFPKPVHDGDNVFCHGDMIDVPVMYVNKN